MFVVLVYIPVRMREGHISKTSERHCSLIMLRVICILAKYATDQNDDHITLISHVSMFIDKWQHIV